jgi:hypothetical protein
LNESYPAFTPPTQLKWHVRDERWFYRNDDEWAAIAERIKRTPCPHCKVVGSLNRHGCLRGFDEASPRRKTVRARRVFCNNRNARPGCGRTFSVWLAHKIRRLSLTSRALWHFLRDALANGLAAAIGALESWLSNRTWRRIWKRFDRAQSKIRTALCERCPPPESLPRPPTNPAHQPAAQVIAHLQTAFPDANCPLADFQLTTRSFFI